MSKPCPEPDDPSPRERVMTKIACGVIERLIAVLPPGVTVTLVMQAPEGYAFAGNDPLLVRVLRTVLVAVDEEEARRMEEWETDPGGTKQ